MGKERIGGGPWASLVQAIGRFVKWRDASGLLMAVLTSQTKHASCARSASAQNRPAGQAEHSFVLVSCKNTAGQKVIINTTFHE